MIKRVQQLNTRIRIFLANLSPGWGLFLLSPVLGELVSAYLSPAEFFFPLIFIITVVPYGCGALIARELVVRNGKGWVSLLILGLAFGLFFEGIVTRIVFNPDWEDLGALGYSRYYAFNWMLAEGVVQFQGVLSIFAAVMLAELIYHDRRHESWIGTRTLRIYMVLLPAWTLVIGLFVPYVPPLPGAFALITVVAALIGLALMIPKHPFARMWAHRPQRTMPRPWVFGLLGTVVMTNMMVCVYVLPESMSDPFPMPIMFTYVLIVDLIAFGLLLRWSGGGTRWDDRHRLGLVIGIMAFYIAFGLFQDIGGLLNEGDSGFAGRSFVSIITIWELHKFWPCIVARVQGDPPDSSPPPVDGSAPSTTLTG